MISFQMLWMCLWKRKFATTCIAAVPTTANGCAVPTTATEGDRSRDFGSYQELSYELGGQARGIIEPMGVGKVIGNRGNVGVLAKTNMFPL
jgi:hypothetical protein